MKKLLLSLVLVASPAFAGTHIHADGLDVDLAAPKPDADVIVEFRQPPLALKAAPLQTFRDTFARFRSDLAAIENRGPSLKSVTQPVIDYEYLQVLHGAACRVPRAVLNDLRLLPYVKRIHPNVDVQAYDDAANTRIGADRVWSTLGARGKGIVVAIIDTGIDYNHPALGGRVIGGYNFVRKSNDPMDDNGHGTHVAGIVGASSSVVSGVAPEVSFRAYKVLNNKGGGKISDVIAGIEQAVTDHADVANLSLGSGLGNPDDAASTAVDNAVAAGMVVCVAAGNGGDYDRIGSPGMARNAITVGASDNNDLLASFTSRGPCAKLASIKPDVVAPGVNILSTLPGNAYGRLSGTSMATPQVAGAAALLRSLHHDWTPAQVKSALMATGAALNTDVMSVGAGRIDVFRAATPSLVASPPQLSFGLDAPNQSTFHQTATLQVSNLSDSARTLTLAVSNSARAGVTLSVRPSSIDLAPGTTQTINVTLVVDNALTGPPPAGSQSFGGYVLFRNGATTEMQVPWGFVKAARATVTYDLPEPLMMWFTGGGLPLFPVPLDLNTLELFAQPADYDLLIASQSQSDADARPDLQAILVEQQHLDGDLSLDVASSAASHLVDFQAKDESGQQLLTYNPGPLSPFWYLASLRFLSDSAGIRNLEMSVDLFASLRMSEITDRYTIEPTETFVDFQTRRIFQAQHRMLTGFHADETLPAGVADYVHIRPTMTFAANESRQVIAYTQIMDRDRTWAVSTGTAAFVSGRTWTPDVWLTPSPDPDRSMAVAFQVNSDGPYPELVVEPLRVVNGKVVSTTSFVPATTTFAASPDATIAFGDGPLYPKVSIHPTSAAVQIYGPLDEWRVFDGTNGMYKLTDGSGSVVASGFAGKPTVTFPALGVGAYRLEYDLQPLSLGDRSARGTLIASFDTSRSSSTPPSITSLSLRDSHGRPVSHVDVGASATIVFSGADSLSPMYSPIDNRATAISLHVEGQPDWQTLKVTQTGEDPEVGLIYRADMPALPDGALVDLKIELADPLGNATSWTLAPAFTVGSAPPFPAKRRRP